MCESSAKIWGPEELTLSPSKDENNVFFHPPDWIFRAIWATLTQLQRSLWPAPLPISNKEKLNYGEGKMQIIIGCETLQAMKCFLDYPFSQNFFLSACLYTVNCCCCNKTCWGDVSSFTSNIAATTRNRFLRRHSLRNLVFWKCTNDWL